MRALARRVSLAGLGLVLACGPAPQPVATGGNDSKALVALLPIDLRARGRSALDAARADLRDRALRELSREGREPVVPFLLALLEIERDRGVRGRLVRELGRWPTADAREGLLRVAEEDRDVALALRALELLHDAQMSDLVAVVEARVARVGKPTAAEADGAERSTSARAQLARAHDHWLTVRFGGLLPRFMREAPPVFSAVDGDRPVRILAFGDFGNGSPEQRETAAAMRKLHTAAPFDFGITLGDNFYPRGLERPNDPRWTSDWDAPYGAMGIPFYPSLGNHDWGDPSSPAAEVLHEDPSWRLPATRYTFTAGAAQLFALDTTALSLDQLDWLDRALDESAAPWKIVYGHHPIRSLGSHGDTPHAGRLLPILAGRADLYLAGHDHDMQMWRPEQGVHMAVIGSGGAGIRPVRAGPRTTFCASRHGFGVLEVTRDRITLRFVDRAGTTIHEARIEREAPQTDEPAARGCLGPL